MSDKFPARIVEKCRIINGTIWYVNLLLNGLFKVDMRTGKVFYMGVADKKEMYLRQAYSEILYYEGCLYMIPYNAAAIGIYDILTGKFDNISIPERTKGKFYEAVLLNDKIYLLPFKARRFYCLDAKTREFSEIGELNNLEVSILSSVEKGGEIWFLEDNGHSLYCYQPMERKYTRIILDKSRGCFRFMGKVGNRIVATAMDKTQILSIDSQTRDIAYFEFGKYLKEKPVNSYFIAEYQGKALLIRTYTNDCIIIDLAKGEASENRLPLDSSGVYGRMWKSEQGLVRLPTVKNKAFHFLDGRTIFLDDERALADWAEKNSFRWKKYGFLPECDIETFLRMVDWGMDGGSEKKEYYGSSIYKALKG